MAPSPLLQLPGAVAADGVDTGLAWHYGDPTGEQRVTLTGTALFDRSNRDVLAVTGDDRLTWLNTLTTQLLTGLPDGGTAEALLLSPQGHVEHHFTATEFNGVTYLETEPGHGAPLLQFLDSMRFWSKVEVATTELSTLRLTGATATSIAATQGIETHTAATPFGGGFARTTASGVDITVPRTDLAELAGQLVAAGARPAGSWAADALRIPTRQARLGVDTDDRTIPNELSWLDTAVHLNKGCYRGQETVARVNNLGRPPRRLAMLNLDGSVDHLPETGDDVLTAEGRRVGRVGTVAHHHENGPIALALIKRNVQPGVPLLAGGVDAMIDPDDAATDHGPPVSAVDRSSLPDLRRR